jgi:hypothetical protein
MIVVVAVGLLYTVRDLLLGIIFGLDGRGAYELYQEPVALVGHVEVE